MGRRFSESTRSDKMMLFSGRVKNFFLQIGQPRQREIHPLQNECPQSKVTGIVNK